MKETKKEILKRLDIPSQTEPTTFSSSTYVIRFRATIPALKQDPRSDHHNAEWSSTIIIAAICVPSLGVSFRFQAQGSSRLVRIVNQREQRKFLLFLLFILRLPSCFFFMRVGGTELKDPRTVNHSLIHPPQLPGMGVPANLLVPGAAECRDGSPVFMIDIN